MGMRVLVEVTDDLGRVLAHVEFSAGDTVKWKPIEPLVDGEETFRGFEFHPLEEGEGANNEKAR